MMGGLRVLLILQQGKRKKKQKNHEEKEWQGDSYDYEGKSQTVIGSLITLHPRFICKYHR